MVSSLICIFEIIQYDLAMKKMDLQEIAAGCIAKIAQKSCNFHAKLYAVSNNDFCILQKSW